MSTQTPIRATAIKAGRLSMAHMHHALTGQTADSPAMRWGRLVHMAILEPVVLASLARWDGYETRDGEISLAKRGKAWDEFAGSLRPGDDYLSADEVPRLSAITAAVAPALARVPRIVQTEVPLKWSDSIYGPATARLDALLQGGATLEVKTARQIEARRFLAAAEGMGYHLQAGWYDFGAKHNGQTGSRWMLVVESVPPHTTALYSLPPSLLAVGYEDARRIASAYRACEACGIYPGPYDSDILTYERPAWAGTVDGGESGLDMEGVEDAD